MMPKTTQLIDDARRLVEENQMVLNMYDVAQMLNMTMREMRKAGIADDVTIAEQLIANREAMKSAMRRKWYHSDNYNMQRDLYKLLATPEEWFRIAGSSMPEQYVTQDDKGDIVWKITGINENK